MERDTPATRIIAECGGVQKLADALGHKHPSKVSNWKQAGRIPAKRIPEVIRAAKKLGKDYQPNDFFDVDAA